MKRFSDFAREEIFLEGTKIKIDDVLNKEIEIMGFRIKKSRFSKNTSGQYLALQFRQCDGPAKIMFTGSDVLIDQIKRYGDEIPFLTAIKKINRYYTFA